MPFFILPILFVAAFEIILSGAGYTIRGVKLPTGQKLPPLRGYMGDVIAMHKKVAQESGQASDMGPNVDQAL